MATNDSWSMMEENCDIPINEVGGRIGESVSCGWDRPTNDEIWIKIIHIKFWFKTYT